jgi:hypothetical protein
VNARWIGLTKVLAKRPIRLHLDTSDYAVMYRAAPGTTPALIRDQLKEMARIGRIEIGLSYHVFFELMRKAEPTCRADRLERAQLLTDLCGRNAFPYPTDLQRGQRFSKEGSWIPRIDLEEIEIERIVENLVTAAAHHPLATPHEVRVFSKRNYLARWVSANPARFIALARDVWPLRFAMGFVESGELNLYLSREMTREDANRKLRHDIIDPATAFDVWFERYGRDDPIARRRNQIADGFVVMLQKIQAMLDESAGLQTQTKELLGECGENDRKLAAISRT